MMKGKTIVDTEKLQELRKLVREFENQLLAAEIATENAELMASDLRAVSYTHLDVYKRQVPIGWGGAGVKT